MVGVVAEEVAEEVGEVAPGAAAEAGEVTGEEVEEVVDGHGVIQVSPRCSYRELSNEGIAGRGELVAGMCHK